MGLWAVFLYQGPGSVAGRVQPVLRSKTAATEGVEQVAPLAKPEEALAEDRLAVDTVRPASPPADDLAMPGARASQAAKKRGGRPEKPEAEVEVAAELEAASLPGGAAGAQGPDEQVQDGAVGEADVGMSGAIARAGTPKTMAPAGYAGDGASRGALHEEAGAKMIIGHQNVWMGLDSNAAR